MKNIRWLLIGILLVCGVIYVGDFIVSAGHPFAELGAGFVLEDTVEHGIVLFVANNVPTVPPLRLELHDTQGGLVSRLVYRERAFPWVDEQEK
ncbi:MAG TPA: hypothetical protein VFA41_07830 [Ktedonobacteraceae bacterium]|jgi:hypothetical protein|nr:hypothetical protein [Ktedonobacteraceae bacterium]